MVAQAVHLASVPAAPPTVGPPLEVQPLQPQRQLKVRHSHTSRPCNHGLNGCAQQSAVPRCPRVAPEMFANPLQRMALARFVPRLQWVLLALVPRSEARICMEANK